MLYDSKTKKKVLRCIVDDWSCLVAKIQRDEEELLREIAASRFCWSAYLDGGML